jgi:hypothetical protein
VTARQQIRGLSGTAAEAEAAYRELGWDAELRGARVELACGTGVEALEMPRAAGVVAVRWWLHTGGVPDQVRCLPGLPAPADAMAVIAAAGRFFLVQPGACPWADMDLAPASGLAVTPGPGTTKLCGGTRAAARSWPRPVTAQCPHAPYVRLDIPRLRAAATHPWRAAAEAKA